MYSEFVRKVIQSAISSSPTAEIITSGTCLALDQHMLDVQSMGVLHRSYLKVKSKFETISSRAYSGKLLKARG
jgi:hypothetical protein